jgi:peptidoglycan/xylan/chitin deacetylase (PgdA/CDA1 family)
MHQRALAVAIFSLAVLLLALRPNQPIRFTASEAVVAAQGPRAPTFTPAPPSPTPAATPAPVAAPVPPFTPLPAGERRYIPILMYHYVRTVDRNADPLGYNLSVTPEQFAVQLAWLAENGYETVRMDAAAACMRGEAACPARAVALTFDDGYMDAYTAALPLLQERGFVATFYIVSGFVGRTGYMGWDELRAMRDAGMEIGSHTVNHPDLTSLSSAAAQREIAQARATLMTELELPILSFCYPLGRFNTALANIVREAGYTSATTTIQSGPQDNLFTLPRLRVSGGMSLSSFAAMIQAVLP